MLRRSAHVGSIANVAEPAGRRSSSRAAVALQPKAAGIRRCVSNDVVMLPRTRPAES